MPLRLQPALTEWVNHLVLALASMGWSRPELAWTILVRMRCAIDTWFGGPLLAVATPAPLPLRHRPWRIYESRGSQQGAAPDETRNPYQRSKSRDACSNSRRRPAG